MTLVSSLIRISIFKQRGISRHLGKKNKKNYKNKKPTTMLLQSMHNFRKNTSNIQESKRTIYNTNSIT